MKADPVRALLTVEEVADELGVPLSRVRRWVADGLLAPRMKRGRAHLFLGRDAFEVEREARAH